MAAINAVRFRVKDGREQEFLDAHKGVAGNWPGLERVNIIECGEGSYCLIAEWISMDAIAKARPSMIATLDTFRDTLEDLGSGLGVTDPVSGEVVLELRRKRRPMAKSAKKNLKAALKPKKRTIKKKRSVRKTKGSSRNKH